MLCRKRAIRFAAMLAALLTTSTQADSLDTALAHCAGVADDDARLACYDAVAAVAGPDRDELPQAAAGTPVPAAGTSTSAQPAAEATPEPSPAPTAEASPVSAAEPPVEAAGQQALPVPDQLGIERVPGAGLPDEPVYTARVVRCEEHPRSGQIYFYFENGQVWKQTNYRRVRFDDCAFDIELTKDAFGYQIYVPDKDRTFRVSRLR